MDVNYCVLSPYRNGGSCSNLAKGHKCSCTAGYTGRKCEQGMSKDISCFTKQHNNFETLNIQHGVEVWRRPK